MEQLLEPVQLLGIVEDDARDCGAIGAVLADHLRAEPLDELAPDFGIVAEQGVDDLVARPRRGAVPRERLERDTLAGADAAREGDRDWAASGARQRRIRRERLLRRPRPDPPARPCSQLRARRA